MNASVYLFGEFNSGYSQYPDDYASAIFHTFSANAKSTTQIAIHRDGNLVYYGYIRKLQQDRYIGLCVVLNSLILQRIDRLFPLYENQISNIVTNGKLIHFSEQGELVTSVEKLYLNQEEIEILTESLRAGFNGLEQHCIALPAVNYGTTKDSSRDFVVDDDQNEIFKSSYTNGYTYIYKSKGFNTAQLNSYKGILCKSYKEKQELQAKLETLEKEHAKTLRQKKQFKFVTILFVILLGFAIGLFFLNDNLNSTKRELGFTKNELMEANQTISNKNSEISDLCLKNDKLNTQYLAERQKRTEVENVYERLQNMIAGRQPFFIKKTSFAFSTGYLTIEYYGITEGNVDIQVRIFGANGESHKTTSSVYVYRGDNTTTIYLKRGLDSGTWYSFEVLKGNDIIGGGRH